MKVTMTGDLLVLYTEGKSSRYRDVARNPVLLKGYVRAVSTMMEVNNTDELKAFSWLHYEKLKYGYAGYSSVRLANHSFTDSFLLRRKME